MRLLKVCLLGLFCGACGGESTANKAPGGAGAAQGGEQTTVEPGGSGGMAGTAGTRSFAPDLGCSSDMDCSNDQVCRKYTPDGPSECVSAPAPATSCLTPDNPRNECCSSADCASGACFSQVVGAGVACGLGGFDQLNQCSSDRCQTDGDCVEGEICAAAGLGSPVRHCIAAACRSDADCTAAPGGACVAFREGCCTTYSPRAQQLACVYASDGCQKAEDCPSGQVCVVDSGRARCATSCGGLNDAGTTP
ncbi:MAG TPA: hypothetical protein VHB79_01660 [Polyangiaceae bacterium]|nr:hypothetical protein [Polyangiaceae bacterium]